MRVKAVLRGYYKHLRYPGEEFEVPDHLHAPYIPGANDGGWQEKLEDTAPEPVPPVSEPDSAASTEPDDPLFTADDPDYQWSDEDDTEAEAEELDEEGVPKKVKRPRKKK